MNVCVCVCVRVAAVGDIDKATDGGGMPIFPPQIPYRLNPSVRDGAPTTKSLHHVTVHV
jgi:hypothetical protein